MMLGIIMVLRCWGQEWIMWKCWRSRVLLGEFQISVLEKVVRVWRSRVDGERGAALPSFVARRELLSGILCEIMA